MKAEMQSLKDNDVWELVPLPEHRKLIGSKWVFKVIIDADEKVERYKAHLVAQGFTQQQGAHYDETFCPVRMESVQTIIALAAQHGLILATSS